MKYEILRDAGSHESACVNLNVPASEQRLFSSAQSQSVSHSSFTALCASL
jgi:hypothetical protein